MTDRSKKIAIAIFMSILILPSLAWGVMSLIDVSGIANVGFLHTDVGEKRDKAELSERENEVSVTEALAEYYDDRIPFRPQLILINRKLNSRIERSYNEMIDDYYSSNIIPVTSPQPQQTEVESVQDVSEEAVVSVTVTSDEPEVTPIQITEAVTEEPVEDIVTSGEISPVSEEDVESIEDYPEEEMTEEPVMAEPESEEYIETDPASLPYYPMRILNNQVIAGRDNWLFYGIENSRDNYEGRNIPDNYKLADFAHMVLAADAICESAGKKLAVLVCPDKETVYPEYYPTVEFASEYRRPMVFYEYMKQFNDVIYLYPLNELKEAKRTCQVYYAYDSHWNAAGGYVGTRELLGALDVDMKSLADSGYEEYEPMSGDLILLANLDVADYTGDKDYHIDPVTDVAPPTEDIIGDGRIKDYHSDASIDQYLVLIGDSYNEQMMKYISDEYAHCTFIHRYATDTPESYELIKLADIIVLETVERNVEAVEDMARSVTVCLQTGEE